MALGRLALMLPMFGLLGYLGSLLYKDNIEASAVDLDRQELPWDLHSESWRTDPVWYDGKAEKCTYEATRTIYGLERRYVALAYTNKQKMDPETMVKSISESGVEVFKHHWSERVPTENYDYDFSTVMFADTSSLSPFKLVVATQEDCGASFKQIWRRGPKLEWFDSVYQPGAGTRRGELRAGRIQFVDALTLVLRDFPFVQGVERVELSIVQSQKDTHQVSFEPVRAEISFRGQCILTLPIGKVEAYRLDLYLDGEQTETATYWFAVDETAPWLHVLLQYKGPEGNTYQLRSLERTAYWLRD